MSRMPVVYLPHGGGPWPFVELGMPRHETEPLRAWLEGLRATLPEAPRAVLVVSAHWEERLPTVSTSAAPPMLYDYYGFPDAAYRVTWPAPGSPALAAQVRALLAAAGLASAEDPVRGFDHGAFVPLKLAFPDADVPTVQLSLVKGLDPVAHLALGRALAPLRDDGVLLVGSGMSWHNLRGFGPGAKAPSTAFDAWLGGVVTAAPASRDAALAAWAAAPAARIAHPREEHLLPLMVVAGAAGADPGRVAFRGAVLGAVVQGSVFG